MQTEYYYTVGSRGPVPTDAEVDKNLIGCHATASDALMLSKTLAEENGYEFYHIVFLGKVMMSYPTADPSPFERDLA